MNTTKLTTNPIEAPCAAFGAKSEILVKVARDTAPNGPLSASVGEGTTDPTATPRREIVPDGQKPWPRRREPGNSDDQHTAQQPADQQQADRQQADQQRADQRRAALQQAKDRLRRTWLLHPCPDEDPNGERLPPEFTPMTSESRNRACQNIFTTWSQTKKNFSPTGPNDRSRDWCYFSKLNAMTIFALKERDRSLYELRRKAGHVAVYRGPIGPQNGLFVSGPLGTGKTELLRLAADVSQSIAARGTRLPMQKRYFTTAEIVAGLCNDREYFDKLRSEFHNHVLFIDDLGLETPGNRYGEWIDLYSVIDWRHSLWAEKKVCTCFATDIPAGELLDVYRDSHRNKVHSERIASMVNKIFDMCTILTGSDGRTGTQNQKGIT